jgi:hypothetical protein
MNTQNIQSMDAKQEYQKTTDALNQYTQNVNRLQNASQLSLQDFQIQYDVSRQLQRQIADIESDIKELFFLRDKHIANLQGCRLELAKQAPIGLPIHDQDDRINTNMTKREYILTRMNMIKSQIETANAELDFYLDERDKMLAHSLRREHSMQEQNIPFTITDDNDDQVSLESLEDDDHDSSMKKNGLRHLHYLPRSRVIHDM